MFIRFKVKNFLSFNKLTEISMIKGKVKNKSERVLNCGDLKVLKFVSIFGANASGKSNLIKAIGFARDCIVDEIPNYKRELFFKGNNDLNSKQPSYFEFEILLDKSVYSYGFEINLTNRKIVSEWLIKLNPKEEVLFSRELKTKKYVLNIKNKNKNLKNKIDVYFDDLSDNSEILFLREMNRLKDKLYNKEKTDLNTLKEVFSWFDDKLTVYGSNNFNSRYTYLLNNSFSDKILETIKSFNTGINKYEFKKLSIDDMFADVNMPKALINQITKDIDKTKKKLSKLGLPKERISKEFNDNFPFAGFRTETSFNILSISSEGELFAFEIKLNHNNSIYEFNFKEESEGTRILFDLMEILFDKQDRFYVIDELDRSLHPQLTYKFVQNFLELAKKRNVQLMVTTHESRLLDFDLLRQDEIWIVNKDELGESSVYSLDEFNVRYDKKIDKAYLEGRYGGVPIFTTIFPIGEDGANTK